jgi:Fe-S cluster assembly scaffold protein SufB
VKTYTINQPALQKIKITESGQHVINLTVAGAEAEISGVFEVKNKDNVNVELIIHHQAPHTRATTTLKGVVRDQAFLKLAGRIIIDPDCGDSNSFLTERVLLLSPEARAEAVPDLEILTDDVKCSHAASISSIPETQLFYLMSRGLSKIKAEELIVEGFLENADE